MAGFIKLNVWYSSPDLCKNSSGLYQLEIASPSYPEFATPFSGISNPAIY